MFSTQGPGPKLGMLHFANDLMPFAKRLPADWQIVSLLPDSEEFLIFAARFGEVAEPAVHATKLHMRHDPISRKIILENLSAIFEDLSPARRCSVPVMLSLIGTRQTLVRRKPRILRHCFGKQFSGRLKFPLRQGNISC